MCLLPNEILESNVNAFYVFNQSELNKRVKFLRERLPENVMLCYAIKANPFLTKALDSYVDRFEVCSPGEGYICRDLAISSEKTVISGVYKTPSFIEELVAMQESKFIFTAESTRQYDLLCELSVKYKRNIQVLLRLTNDSQFGMDEEEAERIVRERKEQDYLQILGIQYFSGTQKTSVKKWKKEIEYLDEVVQRWKEAYDFEVSELEYGPGLPASYFDGDELNETELLGEFSALLSNMKSKINIIIELGRSIAYTCGTYYTHVVDTKTNKGQNYLLVDGGMHQLVYYGQYMAMKTPHFYVYGKKDEEKLQTYNICGALCSMNDIIVKHVELPPTAVGDILCFENTGAYSVTEGIALFLSRDIPSVYLLTENGEYRCLRDSMETRKFNQPKG